MPSPESFSGKGKEKILEWLKDNPPSLADIQCRTEYFGRCMIDTDESYVNIRRVYYYKKVDGLTYKEREPQSDKKVSDFSWRKSMEPVKAFQKTLNSISSSQDRANWEIKTRKPICVAVIGDFHLGAWGTDYELFERITSEILNTDRLYLIIVGDMLEMAIRMRSISEMTGQWPPKMQFKFLDSWIDEIKHKIICATWDNHSVMREEQLTGYSNYADIFSRHTIYHSHIGHIDLKVNKNVYKFAVAHKFMGRSMYNPCHGQMRYMRMNANDRDCCIAGDSHTFGIVEFNEGGNQRLAMNCGTLHLNSGYGKRHFSLTTSSLMPCVSLGNKEWSMTPFKSISTWLSKH